MSQFEPHVKASKAKKAKRNHDQLDLVANSQASPSYSHSPQPYYVTHPSSVIDNDDDYQGEIQVDAQEDKLSTAMMLLTRAITQRYSTPTNNRLRTSSNTRNQVVIQDGRVDTKQECWLCWECEETFEDTEESRLKMKDKMIPLDYLKLNALYESFVPQMKISAEQTYFLSPYTSNVSPESSSKKLDLPPKKMPNESKLLKLFVNLDNKIKELGKLINIHHKMDNDEYHEMRTPKVSNNFTTNTLNNEDTLSSSSIIVEDHEAPQLVSSSEEPIANEPTTLILNDNTDEFVQEDVAELDENTL
nr:hypothetical protein [Tanacetum cinerariifolium]